MICILFNQIQFIIREGGACSYMCVWASEGSCPIRRGKKNNNNIAASPLAVLGRGAVRFSLWNTASRGWERMISVSQQRRAALPADQLTSAFFFPLAFISSTTTQIRGTERRSSRRKCGRERRRQEIWFPSECALQKTVLCNVGKAWWKYRKRRTRLRAHS